MREGNWFVVVCRGQKPAVVARFCHKIDAELEAERLAGGGQSACVVRFADLDLWAAAHPTVDDEDPALAPPALEADTYGDYLEELTAQEAARAEDEGWEWV